MLVVRHVRKTLELYFVTHHRNIISVPDHEKCRHILQYYIIQLIKVYTFNNLLSIMSSEEISMIMT